MLLTRDSADRATLNRATPFFQQNNGNFSARGEIFGLGWESINEAFRGQPVLSMADIDANPHSARAVKKEEVGDKWRRRRFSHAAAFAKNSDNVNFRLPISLWIEHSAHQRRPGNSSLTRSTLSA